MPKIAAGTGCEGKMRYLNEQNDSCSFTYSFKYYQDQVTNCLG